MWVPRDAVRVALGPGSVVGEGGAAVVGGHEAGGLDPDPQPVGGGPVCGSGAIERTWCVQGRGGKLQRSREGMSCSASSSDHDPPSRATNRRLGSVPAYSAPSAALIATERTLGSGRSICSHVAPE